MSREIVATVTLQRPITQGERVIEVLEFVEPDLNALDAMERASKTSGMAATMKLIEKLADQPPSIVQQIKAVDLTQIMAALAPFLPQGATDTSALAGIE